MPGKIHHPAVYRHEQASALQVWNVAHNLGGNGSTGIPIVDVFVEYESAVQKIIPSSVEIVDANNVTITFTTARSGYAIIVV